MTKSITAVVSRMILDSRGNPTVEAKITLEGGATGRASVPSGASTGEREAVEIRDGGKAYGGKGVDSALAHIQKIIAPAVVGERFESQSVLDSALAKLDGSKNKSVLGANAILAVSLAYAKACAVEADQQLFEYIAVVAKNSSPLATPTPMFNVINGGKHAQNSADIQEFMVVPSGIRGFSKQLQAGAEIFHSLRSILGKQGYATTVGDEGGFALPEHQKNTDALELIIEAAEDAGYSAGPDITIALDVAASEFYKNKKYEFTSESRTLSSPEMVDYLTDLTQRYPLISIEDGLDQNDWDNWALLESRIGRDVMLVGDDLLVTNTEFIQRAINEKSCNAVLVKPNQIGTVTETIEAVVLAHKHDFTTIMSHRSGETEDTSIADLAVGLGCAYIKSGSLSRSERLAKYNQLLRIDEQLHT